MKQPFDFKVRDTNIKCIECSIPLKKNVVARKPNAKHCYTCGLIQKGLKFTSRAKTVDGKKIHIRTDLIKKQKSNRTKYNHHGSN